MAGGENIVLIGMPGSGKSTVGVVLAKTLGMDFVDVDLLICRREDCTTGGAWTLFCRWRKKRCWKQNSGIR